MNMLKLLVVVVLNFIGLMVMGAIGEPRVSGSENTSEQPRQ